MDKDERFSVNAFIITTCVIAGCCGLGVHQLRTPKTPAQWELAQPDTLYVMEKQIGSTTEYGLTEVYYDLLLKNANGQTFVFPSDYKAYTMWRLSQEKPEISFAHPGDTIIMQRSYLKRNKRTIDARIEARNISFQTRSRQR